MQDRPYVRYLRCDAQKNTESVYALQCLSLTTVSTNVCRPSWLRQLETAGLKKTVSTVWVMEGMLVYLEAHHVERLLGQLCDACPTGSFLMASILYESQLKEKPRGTLRDAWKWGCPSDVDEVHSFIISRCT